MGSGMLLFFCKFFRRSRLLEYWILWCVRGHCLGYPPNQWCGTCNFDRLFYICGGPVASLRSETAGLLSILQKEERYNGHVQLMSFPDCLVLLIILSKWVQSIFLPVPGLLFVLTCRRDAACSNSPDFPFRLSTQYALRKHKSHSSVKA